MSDPAPAEPRPACRSRRALTWFIAIFVVALAGDLALKAWSFAGNVPPEGTSLVPKILSLRLTENRGAIFGSMQGGKWFFVVASILATGLIVYFFAQSSPHERTTHIGLALILGGAMGNLYDRLAYGFVRDMLHLFPGVKLPFGWRWWGGSDELYPWIFNLADAYLLVGIILVLARSLWTDLRRPRDSASA
jgi:lipoprotein signal peptidase